LAEFRSNRDLHGNQLHSYRGATADEMVAVLVKALPDREADGMRKTVLIQAGKNCTSKERDGRRRVTLLPAWSEVRLDCGSHN
jgi:hypothetical protein